MTEMQIARGLDGIVSHATQLSEVDGTEGRLIIRGYDIEQLAGRVSFEEAAHLLWHGDLPNASELAELRRRMARARRLPESLLDWLRDDGRRAEGMHALRMASAMLTLDQTDPDDLREDLLLDRAMTLTARMPVVIAHHTRARAGQPSLETPEHLGFAASYLYLLDGREPEPWRVEALDAYLVTVMEHGMNASTFTARVIASTQSDMVSAVTGAVGALKGPLHGGVPGPVLTMLDAIGTPDRAEDWVRDALSRGERIMGFGHRVYKVRDPRADVLSRAAERLAAVKGDRRLLDLTREVESATVQTLAEAKPGRDLYANVELYAALILHEVGIPSELFTPTFAAARTAGWTAHVLEQYRENRLIRPQSVYVGPRDRVLAQ